MQSWTIILYISSNTTIFNVLYKHKNYDRMLGIILVEQEQAKEFSFLCPSGNTALKALLLEHLEQWLSMKQLFFLYSVISNFQVVCLSQIHELIVRSLELPGKLIPGLILIHESLQ